VVSIAMPAPNFVPAFSLYSALTAAPLRPLHTFVRTTEERLRPAQWAPHRPAARGGAAALHSAHDRRHQSATILREAGNGRVPTIVLGGLVPDATEQVFLLRRFLLRSGDIYYVQYPRADFSLDVLCAQLDDLVVELCAADTPPIVFAVSFGAGIVLEWLRRSRLAKHDRPLAGLVLVSPVTCAADLISPHQAKPATLLGRALKPYLGAEGDVPETVIAKSRALFVRMFEAGAQNREALRALMTKDEAERLRTAVTAAIRDVTAQGAQQRARALSAMAPPIDYFSPTVLPLHEAPTLVLFAESEDAVLDRDAPVRFVLERAPQAYFPQAQVHCVTARRGAPAVQHTSLIFPVFEFLPRLQAFYQRVRRGPLAFAA
jgi:alpha-beta hydrolase superfamily lysophospholipase